VQMARIIEDTFDKEDLRCPVCGLSLVPPVQEYCDHIALYCVQGYLEDSFIEYHVDGISLDIDNMSSDEKWLEVASEYTLSIYKFTEQDAHYPTTIILGINSQ
jgi:hypothetical protein